MTLPLNAIVTASVVSVKVIVAALTVPLKIVPPELVIVRIPTLTEPVTPTVPVVFIVKLLKAVPAPILAETLILPAPLVRLNSWALALLMLLAKLMGLSVVISCVSAANVTASP